MAGSDSRPGPLRRWLGRVMGREKPIRIAGALHQPADVLLVSMPFAPPNMPPIGISLLKGALNSLDIRSRILYFSLRFVDLIGNSRYRLITSGATSSSFVGEWLFSSGLFDATASDVESYVQDVLKGHKTDGSEPLAPEVVEEILDVRTKIDGFLDDCLQEVLAHRPKIVGFTSTFEQHLAALDLAKRLRAEAPETFILFGGANCESSRGVETLR